jgi:hypothetical protein
MSKVYVKCKTKNCGVQVLAPEEHQVPKDHFPSILFKKNYYLCQKCGKVYPYTREEHFVA